MNFDVSKVREAALGTVAWRVWPWRARGQDREGRWRGSAQTRPGAASEDWARRMGYSEKGGVPNTGQEKPR